MTKFFKRVWTGLWLGGMALTGAAGPAAAALPPPGPVGADGRATLVVRCESFRLRQVACPAASDANVRLGRVLGGRCIPGITWFYDKRAIHVRGDCRALFVVGGAPRTIGQPGARSK